MLTIPKIVIPGQFNAATAFLDRNLGEGRSSKTAVYFEGNSYTYAQIAELANRVGNGLSDLGVEMEQRVALLLLDSPQFAASFFGAIKMGAVPIPLNTNLRPNDYVYMLNDSRARALLIHSVTDFNLQIPANAMLFAWIAGTATALVTHSNRGAVPVQQRSQ